MTKLIDFSLTFAADSVTLESPAIDTAPLLLKMNDDSVRDVLSTILATFNVSHEAKDGYKLERDDVAHTRKVIALCSEDCLRALTEFFQGAMRGINDVEEVLNKKDVTLKTIMLTTNKKTCALHVDSTTITVNLDDEFISVLGAVLRELEDTCKNYTIVRHEGILTQKFKLATVYADLIKVMFELQA